MKKVLAAVLMGLTLTACTNKQTTNEDMNTTLTLTQEWDKVFPQSNKVTHEKVTFKNRFGIELAADLYQPVLDQGKIKPFLGYNIKVVNNLPLVEEGGSWYRMCPVFTKDAVGLGVWEDFNSFAYVDNDRMRLPRLAATFTLGATRLDNEKIRVLKVKEA